MKKILIILLSILSFAQSQSFDGAGLSLAGNYAASSRGINALGYNPANLALYRGNTMELNLLSVNAFLANNSFSLNSYNRYFTLKGNHGWWSASDKNAILDLIPDDGLGLNFDVHANVFGLAFNNFAMAAQLVSQGQANIKAGKFLRIGLFGETVDNSYKLFQPSVADIDAYSALKVSFAYAYPFSIKKLLPQSVKRLLPEISMVSVGASLNYYVGFAVAQSTSSNLMLKRNPAQEQSEESAEYDVYLSGRKALVDDGAPAGRGKSFDFGLATGYGKDWDISLSFLNIAGKINWTGSTEMFYIHHYDSISFAEDENADEQDWAVDEDSTMAIGSFSTPLPAVMRVGVAWRIRPNWRVSADWQQGLNEAFGNSTTPRLGLASEYYVLGWLPLRTGMAIGGREGFQYGLGLGFNFRFFDFDLSYAMNRALWPTYSRGAFIALSMKIKI